MPGIPIEQLELGMAAETVRSVSEADVLGFAEATGDRNPVHTDAAFAAETPFRERIAHGLLAAGFISALLGTRLPGPGSLYVSQTLSFKRPVKIGDEVTARVEITAIDHKSSQVTLQCTCTVRGKRVLEGEAVVIPPRQRKR